MRKHEWSVPWSGGKDSTATIWKMIEYEVPIKDITYVRMMYDETIPATLPVMTEFVDKSAERFRDMGFNVNIVPSCMTAKQLQDKIYTDKAKRHKGGKYYGVTAFGRGHCRFSGTKQKTSELFSQSEYAMIGYCADETKRIHRLGNGKESILVELGIKEDECYQICREHEMLSPLYELGMTRDGCWFCPNAAKAEREYLRHHHPELVRLINQSINQCDYNIDFMKTRNNWVKDYFNEKNYYQMDIYDFIERD